MAKILAERFWRSFLCIALSAGLAILGCSTPADAEVAMSPASRLQAFAPASSPIAQADESAESDRALALLRPYLDRLRREVKSFTLNNGMRFLVLERHSAPVVSFVTYADVGGADEQKGQTGVAHYLEHLAFKGTPTLGTRDYAAEQILFEKLDQTFERIKQARQSNNPALTELEAEFAALQAEASQLVKQNELGQTIEKEGGVGLNATTSADATNYFYSLPSNKLELWMYLESERFREPVFREFYEEKEVILEERRMRLDNDPVSQLFEAMKNEAFQIHPYGQPLIGEVEDLRNLTRAQVQQFFEQHYGPKNLTVAIVGDVELSQVKHFAQQYFGNYRPRDLVESRIPAEPVQTAERRVTLETPAQPWHVEAYHIPSMDDPDYIACSVLSDILSSGRTSRLYRTLVEEQQVALAAQGLTGYPGDKYPNLMVFYALVAPGKTLEQVQAALDVQLQALVEAPPTAAELARIKTRLKASLLRSLDSNLGMARVLTEYQAKTGNWENLLRDLEAIAQLQPSDIQRVAQQVLRPENRTVAQLLPSSAESM